MKQQTAVDKLISDILKHDKSFLEFYKAEIQQAKEMEKKHIMDAHNQGYADGYRDNGNSPIDYYNETYENK